jgi:predicted Zn-dependent protease
VIDGEDFKDTLVSSRTFLKRNDFPCFGAFFLRFRGFLGFLFFCSLLSCGTKDAVRETPLLVQPPSGPETQTASRPSGGGVADEIRSLTEKGSPSSLLGALELIRARDLGATEFGRIMIAVNVTLIRKLYPSVLAQLPQTDPPQTHVYAKILREIERGLYTPPQANSQDYLEYTLPFLALIPGPGGKNPSQERLLSSLPDLRKAGELNPGSALAPYFLGLVFEGTGRPAEAAAEFSRVYESAPECYPAALGLARVMTAEGREKEALQFLSDLVIRLPDNLMVKRQLALAYYNAGDWSRAEPAIAEILQRDSRDGEFILMRARVLVEQGLFLQAQAPLDLYSSINPNNRLYLFLRARVQAEGYRNRDAALNYLRSILRSSPADDETSVYAARLLLESNRQEDQKEGRGMLENLLKAPVPSLAVISLALQEAVRQENWREGRAYVNRLLEERRSSQDLLYAYFVARGLGNNAEALSYAREIHERDPSNEEGANAYVSALIDTGRLEEAGRMIESRLNSVPGGVVKSRYYYLRSRLRNNEEAVMNELRSSLFEDPRNLNALIAMFEIYHRRRDERRAVYYLKQALALAPNNPLLKRYEAEYAAALGGA